MKLEFNLTIDDLLYFTGGKSVLAGESMVFNEIFTNSRDEFSAYSIFVAFKGKRYNGENFVGDVFKKGASCALVSWDFLEKHNLSEYKGKTIIAVNDTITAYGKIAGKYLGFFGLKKKIAITGSTGKTTTKEIAYKIFRDNFGEGAVLKNEYNFNNLIGVPKTILGLNKKHEFMILEIGTNIKGEIHDLSDIIKPDITAIVNIGKSHLQEFKTMEAVLEEKFSAIYSMKNGSFFILNGDDPLLSKKYDSVNGINFLSFGINNLNNTDIKAKDIEFKEGAAKFNIIFKEKEYTIRLSISGIHFIYDVLCALLIGWTCGIDIEAGINAIKDFKLPKGRMEIVASNPDGSVIINDSYNSNPDSLKAAFDSIRLSYPDKKKILVLGDMLELGESSEIEHFNAGRAAAKFADYIFYMGNYGKYLLDGLVKDGFDRSKVIMCRNGDFFRKKFSEVDKRNSVILIKGSRDMQMEKYFEEK